MLLRANFSDRRLSIAICIVKRELNIEPWWILMAPWWIKTASRSKTGYYLIVLKALLFAISREPRWIFDDVKVE